MEDLEMIKVDDNGQLFIDFESLESITSVEFVERIKYWVLRDSKCENFKFRVVPSDYFVNVYINSDGAVRIFQFMISDGFISSIFVPDFELKKVL